MLEDVKRDLAALGYHAKWLEHSFLGEANLQLQIENYHASDDRNAEHYRYGTFRLVLHSRPALDDAELTHYVELALLDEDRMMGDAALADLCGWHGLTPEQFEWISRHPTFQHPYLQKIIHRKRLHTELRDGPLTDDLFARCLAFRDDSIHRSLLATPGLTEPQMQALSERGGRAVRNMARVELNRRAKGAGKRERT